MNLQDAIGNPTRRELRIFAAGQLPFFCLLFFSWHGRNWQTWELVVAGISAIVAVLGLVRPAAVRPIYTAWMLAVFPIGWLVSHLVLGIVYYLVVTPIGLLRRLVSGDPMHRCFDRQAETYWQPRRPVRDPKRYFRQF